MKYVQLIFSPTGGTEKAAELMATGLLLGYPLESTASILLGN